MNLKAKESLQEQTEPQILSLGSFGDTDVGYLTFVQQGNPLPFEIKRAYWTYHTPADTERGRHAHKMLQQLIVAVSGAFRIRLEDQSGKVFDFKLDHPSKGLYIPRLYWRTLIFEANSTLLCLASQPYLEEDYIHSYSEFKNYRADYEFQSRNGIKS
jgi:hypothetical protein